MAYAWNQDFTHCDLRDPLLARLFMSAFAERCAAVGIAPATVCPNWSTFAASGAGAAYFWQAMQQAVDNLGAYFLVSTNPLSSFSFIDYQNITPTSPPNSTAFNSLPSYLALRGFTNPYASSIATDYPYTRSAADRHGSGGYTRKFPREIWKLSQSSLASNTARLIYNPTPTGPCGDPDEPSWNNITNAYPSGSTYVPPGPASQPSGVIYRYDGAAWNKVTTPFPAADIVDGMKGRIISGDYIGGWIANEIRDQINRMVYTVGASQFPEVPIVGNPIHSLNNNVYAWPYASFRCSIDPGPAGTNNVRQGHYDDYSATPPGFSESPSVPTYHQDWADYEFVGTASPGFNWGLKYDPTAYAFITCYTAIGDDNGPRFSELRIGGFAKADMVPVVTRTDGSSMNRLIKPLMYYTAGSPNGGAFADFYGQGIALNKLAHQESFTTDAASYTSATMMNDPSAAVPMTWPTYLGVLIAQGWTGTLPYAFADWSVAGGFEYTSST